MIAYIFYRRKTIRETEKYEYVPTSEKNKEEKHQKKLSEKGPKSGGRKKRKGIKIKGKQKSFGFFIENATDAITIERYYVGNYNTITIPSRTYEYELTVAHIDTKQASAQSTLRTQYQVGQ